MFELCLNGRCHSHLILGFGLVSSQELEAGAGANSGGDGGIGDARGIFSRTSFKIFASWEITCIVLLGGKVLD